MFGKRKVLCNNFTGVRVWIESMFNAFICCDLVIKQFSLISTKTYRPPAPCQMPCNTVQSPPNAKFGGVSCPLMKTA
jgi:hypothetical protein